MVFLDSFGGPPCPSFTGFALRHALRKDIFTTLLREAWELCRVLAWRKSDVGFLLWIAFRITVSLRNICLKKTNFGLTFTSFLAEHFLAITLSRNFGKLLSGTLLGIILGINFGILEDNSGKFSEIRRPWPWPRQGRRLGPRQVWNFSFLAFQGRLPALKAIA